MSLSKETKKNIGFIVTTFILLAVLAASVFFLIQKSMDYNDLKAEMEENTSVLAQAQSTIDEYSSRIDEYASNAESDKKTQSELQSGLDAAKREKDRLEKENSALKQQLVAKKIGNEKESLRLAIKYSHLVAPSEADSNAKIAYLTFDDGPSQNTLNILNILNSYGIKATFFVVGNTGNIDYVKKIDSAGHTVGLHSATHNYSQIYSSTDNFLNDLESISAAVEIHTGKKSLITRFPGGSSNVISQRYNYGIMTKLTALLPEKGYFYFDWNVDSADASSAANSPKLIAQNVLNGANGKNRICVLMHDAAAKKATVQALPDIIEGLYNMGYKFMPITIQTQGFHQPVAN